MSTPTLRKAAGRVIEHPVHGNIIYLSSTTKANHAVYLKEVTENEDITLGGKKFDFHRIKTAIKPKSKEVKLSKEQIKEAKDKMEEVDFSSEDDEGASFDLSSDEEREKPIPKYDDPPALESRKEIANWKDEVKDWYASYKFVPEEHRVGKVIQKSFSASEKTFKQTLLKERAEDSASKVTTFKQLMERVTSDLGRTKKGVTKDVWSDVKDFKINDGEAIGKALTRWKKLNSDMRGSNIEMPLELHNLILFDGLNFDTKQRREVTTNVQGPETEESIMDSIKDLYGEEDDDEEKEICTEDNKLFTVIEDLKKEISQMKKEKSNFNRSRESGQKGSKGKGKGKGKDSQKKIEWCKQGADCYYLKKFGNCKFWHDVADLKKYGKKKSKDENP
jgi:hypothetical protein